jgi:membrane-associated protease RseP (regulator of RpoE activity)
MQKMDNPTNEEAGGEPEIIRAEVVEITPGAPWEWREVRPVRPRRRWLLHILLFVATCVSTWLAGMTMVEDEGFQGLMEALRYAVPVMTILLCHEMGHFLQAYRYGVYATLPYFIPMPIVSPFGTMGAVIAMEPRIGGRRALFDIGISGPLAGLAPTFIFLIIGLHHSTYAIPPRHEMSFGDPSILRFFATMIRGPIPEGCEVVKSPMAFAGWVGLFITSLNLIPIGQLDGGHVLYALLRRKANRVAKFLLFAALFLVIWKWELLHFWLVMLALLFMMGPMHPPTADDEEPLGLVRTVLGWLTLAFIFIGFTPVPIIFPR